MSRPTMSTSGVLFGAAREQRDEPIRSDSPLHILLLGDFSARANNGRLEPSSIGSRRLIEVDRDNLEEVFSSLAIQLQLPVADEPIVFGEFDDLHPDFLYQRLSLFEDLRTLRRRLQKPELFAAAAEEIRSWSSYRSADDVDSGTAQPAGDASSSPGDGPAIPDNLLEAVLSGTETVAHQNTSADSIDRLIKDMISPYIEKKTNPELPDLLAAVASANTELLRKICHASAFRQLEAAWLSVLLLVRRLETDSQLKIFIADVAREELLVDIEACGGQLEHSGIYQLLVERQTVAGGTSFALINADYHVTQDPADISLVSALATMAQQTGASVAMGASPVICGCSDISRSVDPSDWDREPDPGWAEQWQALRHQPQAAHLALAAPRFLLRLPYGKQTSSIDSFDYQELPADGAHPYYLWGNSAYLLTLLLALHYQSRGWSFQPGQIQFLEDFALHVYTDEDGDTAIKPCAEVMLTDSGSSRLAGSGLLAVRSVKGSADIMISHFSSLGENASLAGRWSS